MQREIMTMGELYEDKERTPLLKEIEKHIDESTDKKSNSQSSSTRFVRTDILSTMPPVAIQIIAKQLYNKRGGDKKIAPSKDVAKLKATSRHFYGKNPDTLCLPNTRKYADKSIRLFTCELGFQLLEVGKGPDFRQPHEVDKCNDYSAAAILCLCCLPTSIVAGTIGGLIGCVIDTRNAINSAKIKSNRLQEPEHGYLSSLPLSNLKSPSDQSMT